MLKYILIGSGFAFAAAAQPGPLQAFYLSRVASSGWRRTLPASLAPVISDGPIAVLILLVLHRLPDGFEGFLKAAGGILLLYFAGRTFLEWRRGKDGAQSVPHRCLRPGHHRSSGSRRHSQRCPVTLRQGLRSASAREPERQRALGFSRTHHPDRRPACQLAL